MKLSLAFLLVLSSISALASTYSEGCVEIFLFHLENANDAVKAHLRKSCECQEKELRKRGITDTELADFVKGAGKAQIDPAAMKVAPKLNPILQSKEVRELCEVPLP